MKFYFTTLEVVHPIAENPVSWEMGSVRLRPDDIQFWYVNGKNLRDICQSLLALGYDEVEVAGRLGARKYPNWTQMTISQVIDATLAAQYN